jgi:hypothetical protein
MPISFIGERAFLDRTGSSKLMAMGPNVPELYNQFDVLQLPEF